MALPLNPAILDPQAPTAPSFVAAPWTDDQVENLNRYQRAGLFHPFTCGRRDQHSDNGILIAERDGWHCPADGCDYRQTWAHPFMAAPPTPDMVKHEQRLATLRARATGPRPCLLHADIHPDHGIDCMRDYLQWMTAHPHLRGRAARDAYALEVEQLILDRLVREYAPARTRRINPALTK